MNSVLFPSSEVGPYGVLRSGVILSEDDVLNLRLGFFLLLIYIPAPVLPLVESIFVDLA